MNIDIIDVTPFQEKDPKWNFIDDKGHIHKWSFKEEMKDTSDDPDEYGAFCDSLIYVVDSEAFGDYPETGHYECKLCGQKIVPGFRSPPYRRYRRIVWLS